jgi:hypothetical protein
MAHRGEVSKWPALIASRYKVWREYQHLARDVQDQVYIRRHPRGRIVAPRGPAGEAWCLAMVRRFGVRVWTRKGWRRWKAGGLRPETLRKSND